MLFRMLYDEDLAQAAYLIGCQKTGEALIIDPERDIDRYIAEAARHGLRIVAVAETHIHADFLSGGRELAERVGAKLYVSDEGDADWKYGWLNGRRDGGSYDHQLLHDGDVFRVGQIEIRALHTPGHTPEHLSFIVTDIGGGANEPIGIATGDFVFVGDVGRPDLLETAAGFANVKEASARALAKSAGRLADLPEYVQVWPAHGAGSACGKALGAVPQSTVGYELRFNPALRLARDESAFVNYVLAGQPEPPLYFGRMKVQNRDGAAVLGQLPRPRKLTAAELKQLDGKRVAVLDTRDWASFRDGHLPGALFAPLGSAFPVAAGSYVQPDEDIILIANAESLDRAVRNLVRIGLDRVIAYATPESLHKLGPQLLERTEELPVEEARDLLGRGQVTLLDVRGAAERAEGFIHDSIHIAHTRLAEHVSELDKQTPIIVHCRSGARSAMAAGYLARRGFRAINLAGGFEAWKRAQAPIETGSAKETSRGAACSM